jgi:CRISPR system Cascade subunit CasD
MALQGPRIDGEPQSLPIPTRSLLTGMFGSALGFGRGDHERLQALQDNMHVGVVVHRNGVEINDYQIADLGKSHMRGPMWSSGTSIAERTGSQIEGLRQQQRPYRADADMTAVVETRVGILITAEQILAALDQPVHPLFIGRTSCPPASRLAGHIFDAPSLEVATLKVAQDHPGEIYLPAEAATPSWGDLPLSIPGRRDWASFRHAGADLYVVRQCPPSAPA